MDRLHTPTQFRHGLEMTRESVRDRELLDELRAVRTALQSLPAAIAAAMREPGTNLSTADRVALELLLPASIT
jgi:hypothetical protein